MDSNLRIIYYGNPSFAVPSLELLLKNNYQVIGVVTSPDKPAGRGLKIIKPEVKICAEKYGLKILQPEKLTDENFIQEIKELKPDLQVVIAFRKLPTVIWQAASRGTINLHPSLLPDYRGAAPVNWVIINGEKETAVSTIFINDEIDCGDVILQEKVAISENDTAGTLHDMLSIIGAEAILKTVRLIENGNVKINRQPYHENLKKAPKISRNDCHIDWNKKPTDIFNFIRGLSPYPGAWTYLNDKVFKIYKADIELSVHDFPTGRIITDHKTFLKTAVPEGFINIKETQLEGKKILNVTEFLKGFKFEENSFFL